MDNQNQEWRLQRLEVNYNLYGEHKDQYTGSARFTNGVKMDVNFMLDQSKCNKFISLIQEEIQEQAKNLGSLLVTSMPIALPPATKTE